MRCLRRRGGQSEPRYIGLPQKTRSGFGGKRRRSGTDELPSLRGREGCETCADEAASSRETQIPEQLFPLGSSKGDWDLNRRGSEW